MEARLRWEKAESVQGKAFRSLVLVRVADNDGFRGKTEADLNFAEDAKNNALMYGLK